MLMLLIIILSYLIPIYYRKNPTRQKKILSYLLVPMDGLYIIREIARYILDKILYTSISVFNLRTILLISLFGWLIYRIFNVVKNGGTEEVENNKSKDNGLEEGNGDQEEVEKRIRRGNIKMPIDFDFHQLRNKDKAWEHILTLGGSLLTMIIIFQNWLHIIALDRFNNLFFTPSSGLKSRYSPFNLSRILYTIYSHEQDLNMVRFLNYIDLWSILLEIGVILIILIQLLYLFKFFKNDEIIGEIGIISSLVTSLISIAFIILVIKVDKGITSKVYGFNTRALEATAMPYLAIASSLPAGIYGAISRKKKVSED